MNRPLVIRTRVLAAIFGLCFGIGTASAQNPVEDAIKQLNSDNVRGYLQPFVNGFGANLNSGLYHSASIAEMGISVRFDIVAMGTMIGDAEKVFTAVAPPTVPYAGSPVQTATIYGGQGTIISDPSGVSYQFQNGEVKTSIIPLAVPQLTVGNFYGTQAVVRYAPIPSVGNFPKVTLFGIGARHSISRYLPTVPVDLAVSAFYQKFDVGEIMSAHAVSLGAQASKSFSVLTLYGGMAYESSSMDLSYTYTGPGATPNTKVGVSIDGENSFRATAGFGLNLVILNLSADVNVGKVTVLSAAVGFGI
jgi:hypothetical protein